MIRKVHFHDNFNIYAKLLNESFADVACEFGLTMENSPTNNAFITEEKLRLQLSEKEREFFYFEENNVIIGFIAIERSSNKENIFYIEKVAVHPQYRHKGIGKQLMDFAIGRIIELKGEEISIGLIEANSKLKNWYKKQSFIEIETKSYEHLPFRVCIMHKYLK